MENFTFGEVLSIISIMGVIFSLVLGSLWFFSNKAVNQENLLQNIDNKLSQLVQSSQECAKNLEHIKQNTYITQQNTYDTQRDTLSIRNVLKREEIRKDKEKK